MRKIHVFDTTLRDGEQVPGAKLNLKEKMEIAIQLEKLRVDFMEVGFPSSSQGDFEAVKAISQRIQTSTVVALGRAVKSDIDIMYESLKYAKNPMIHIVLGSSAVHINKKFHKNPEEIMNMGAEAVAYAKKYLSEIEYSLEDASRSELEYMWKTIEKVVKAGATCVNIPDTVGIAIPEKFGELISTLHDRLMNTAPDVLLSVHCHNDMGLGVANTLAAVKNGANKVECTINGIGERAGNTSLEEVVMGIKIHPEYYDAFTNVNFQEIYASSRIVSRTMGLDVQVNKALVGENAFAHSSGIHQDGLLKSKDVYEIMEPADIGAPPMDIVLTARSGKHAFSYIASKLGYEIPVQQLEPLHQQFLKIADAKKEIYDNDLIALLEENVEISQKEKKNLWKLEEFQMMVNMSLPSATVKLSRDGKEVCVSETGNGAIDALYSAIIKGTGCQVRLIDYRIHNLGTHKESLGKVVVQIQSKEQFFYGKAIEFDVIKASAVALLNAINKMMLEE